MPDLYKARLKCKDIWIRESKGGRIALPGDPPIRAHMPTITVDKERKIAVIEEKLSVQSFNMDWLCVLLSRNKIERCIGLGK